jgi:hypothetical protein
MKFALPLITIMCLSACNESVTSKDIDHGAYTAPLNLFIKETNMTLDIEKECGEEPAITANQ